MQMTCHRQFSGYDSTQFCIIIIIDYKQKFIAELFYSQNQSDRMEECIRIEIGLATASSNSDEDVPT